MSVFSVRNLVLAKWNVEYILQDFSEKRKLLLAALEMVLVGSSSFNGPCIWRFG